MTCTENEMQRRNDALVVIPAYNEAATIGKSFADFTLRRRLRGQ